MELCIRRFRKPKNTNISRSGSRVTYPLHCLAPPTADRATSFFIHHFVWQAGDEATQYTYDYQDQPLSLSPRGTNEYLPGLLNQPEATEAFKAIVTATGLAAMANAGHSMTWRAEAYSLYSKAIGHLRTDLSDPVRSKLDDTLATVMLMGTFEV